MLGLKTIYMDAGSGAKNPISETLIAKVSSQIHVPLIIGGGIKTAEKIEANCRAGATINVVGNAIEKSPSLIIEMAQATKEAKSFAN
jgi:putative glycerol-1-phosphate prenyltransferase